MNQPEQTAQAAHDSLKARRAQRVARWLVKACLYGRGVRAIRRTSTGTILGLIPGGRRGEASHG